MTLNLYSCRHVLIFLALVGVVACAQIGAFVLRFEFSVPPVEMYYLRWGVIIALCVKLPVLYAWRLHRGWISFSGVEDLRRIVQSTVLSSAAFAVCTLVVFRGSFVRSVYILDFLFTLAAVCWMRVLIRIVKESRHRRPNHCKQTLIYGAGQAGTALAKEIVANPKLGYSVVGFLDDARHLRGEWVMGLPVLGSGADVPRIVASFEKRRRPLDIVLIAIPSATHEQMSVFVSACNSAGLTCKTLPSYGELLNGRLSTQIREIRLEDLLSREAVVLEEENIRASISGKCILITGAAGSIGSELAVRVSEFQPETLILLDNAESGIFRVDMLLRQSGYNFMIHSVIGDIRDYQQIESVIRHYDVQTIFHAAAYKHVPLMEDHALQAVANNVIGTWNVTEAAFRNGVKSFTLISSDKAVNPTNVMGATKRAAELIISSYPPDGGGASTRFTAVRFGNVLGSNGSVVPTFQWQISRGGPVTVTHPEATRYFMTVREAVQLVLQASTMSKGSDIFVLDMGEPVRILDLAKNVIRLAGLVPEIDVPIEITGLRPGEKLYEELIASGENVAPTYHSKIRIFTGPGADRARIEGWIARMKRAIARNDEHAVVRMLHDVIPEYKPDAKWGIERKAVAIDTTKDDSGFHVAASSR